MPPSKVVKVITSKPEEVNVGADPPAYLAEFPPPPFAPALKVIDPAPPLVISKVIELE